ncbi:MAG: hypothetical protein JNJ54_25485 [Myxococcaceae bacterium]|nr:hypothetical protein [Myxococcaceae bacterium]
MTAKAPDPEVDAAIAAVAEGPLDEGRRRVLADLLLERGDPRGEFLVLQFLIAARQGSGPMRQRAEELWRRHRHEWMAGLESCLTELELENGFPVSASIRPGLKAAQLDQLLASPMAATLQRLDSQGDEQALVRVASAPRFCALDTLTVRSEPTFLALAEHAVPGRLRRLRLAFVPTWPRLTQLVSASTFEGLQSVSFRLADWAPPTRQFLRHSQEPSGSTPLSPGKALELLARRPSITEVHLSAATFGDAALFQDVARVWPHVPFERVTCAGTFELVREAGATTLTLQNLGWRALIDLRRVVPPDVTRARLMVKREPRAAWSVDENDPRAALAAAWAGIDVTTM